MFSLLFSALYKCNLSATIYKFNQQQSITEVTFTTIKNILYILSSNIHITLTQLVISTGKFVKIKHALNLSNKAEESYNYVLARFDIYFRRNSMD